MVKKIKKANKRTVENKKLIKKNFGNNFGDNINKIDEKIKIIFSIVFAISILLSLLLLNFRVLVFNEKYCKSELEKYGVYERFPELSKEEVDVKIKEAMLFLKGKTELQQGFFSEDEIAHFSDVRAKIEFANNILLFSILITIILALYLLYNFKHLRRKNILKENMKIMRIIFALTLFLIIILFIASQTSFGFDFLFTKFHQILFRNGNWMFAEDSSIIRMFPEIFFQNFAKKIFILFFIEVSIFLIILTIVLKKKKFICNKA